MDTFDLVIIGAARREAAAFLALGAGASDASWIAT